MAQPELVRNKAGKLGMLYSSGREGCAVHSEALVRAAVRTFTLRRL